MPRPGCSIADERSVRLTHARPVCSQRCLRRIPRPNVIPAADLAGVVLRLVFARDLRHDRISAGPRSLRPRDLDSRRESVVAVCRGRDRAGDRRVARRAGRADGAARVRARAGRRSNAAIDRDGARRAGRRRDRPDRRLDHRVSGQERAVRVHHLRRPDRQLHRDRDLHRVSIFAAYLGARVGAKQRVGIGGFGNVAVATGGTPKVLDTSVIIDGRILDIVSSGFLDGRCCCRASCCASCRTSPTRATRCGARAAAAGSTC